MSGGCPRRAHRAPSRPRPSPGTEGPDPARGSSVEVGSASSPPRARPSSARTLDGRYRPRPNGRSQTAPVLPPQRRGVRECEDRTSRYGNAAFIRRAVDIPPAIARRTAGYRSASAGVVAGHGRACLTGENGGGDAPTRPPAPTRRRVPFHLRWRRDGRPGRSGLQDRPTEGRAGDGDRPLPHACPRMPAPACLPLCAGPRRVGESPPLPHRHRRRLRDRRPRVGSGTVSAHRVRSAP